MSIEEQIVEEAKKLFYDEAAKDKIGFRYRPTYDTALDKAILSAIKRAVAVERAIVVKQG